MINKSSYKQNKNLYFLIGTIAELIKVLAVLVELSRRGYPYKVVATGQNDIGNNELFEQFNLSKPSITLSKGPEKKSFLGLLIWFIRTLFNGIFSYGRVIRKEENLYIVVHGDTVSTLLGSLIGKIFRAKIAHIEAGLRSFNYMHPFPEEIDRVLVSKLADYHYCPNSWAIKNLKKTHGNVINTYNNTLMDSMNLINNYTMSSRLIDQLKNKKYFIFVMHRQENLFNTNLVKYMINKIDEISYEINCVFVMHPLTENTLAKLKLRNKLKDNSRIILTPRLGYNEFTNLLNKCEFIITDGGSNQEEAYYLGKPCLVMRNVTERTEGLGENVILCKNNYQLIDVFVKDYKKYSRKKVKFIKSPTNIIVDNLLSN